MSLTKYYKIMLIRGNTGESTGPSIGFSATCAQTYFEKHSNVFFVFLGGKSTVI